MILLKLLHLALLAAVAAAAETYISSKALLTCMENSAFTASQFDVTFFPHNSSVYISIASISTIEGNVTANVEIIAYGLTIINKTINGCDIGVDQFCPISPGHIDLTTTEKVSGVTNQIPGIAYTFPDIDAKVRIQVYETKSTTMVACVEMTLTNGKTVQSKYVMWATAAVFGLGLITAGIVSVYGYPSTASHIAANSISLFSFFQAMAMMGMLAVESLPPIAAAWCENFVWTMGIIPLKFMQDIFSWYVQSTGGTSVSILPNIDILSIEVEKKKRDWVADNLNHEMALKYVGRPLREGAKRLAERAVFGYSGVPDDGDYAMTKSILRRGLDTAEWGMAALDVYGTKALAAADIYKRATNSSSNSTSSSQITTNERDPSLTSKVLVLQGMQRVAYLIGIEITNLFLTGLTFFVVAGVVVIIVTFLTKLILELFCKLSKNDRFQEFRQGWRNTCKGILFRLLLLGFPQLTVLCCWQLVERDSPATVALAVIAYVVVCAVIGFAAFKVVSLAKRSEAIYKNPAYLLFSDAATLNRWGFLYIQYRATAYYFLVPVLIYYLAKGAFIGFAQSSGKTQAFAIFLIEAVYLGIMAWKKPFMDKTTNAMGLAIQSIVLVDSFLFVFFSKLFNQPDSVSSIMAVVFFVLNAVFALVLLLMIIFSVVRAIVVNNPDTRYQPMQDDRASFIKDPHLGVGSNNNELNALGASAKDGYNHNSFYGGDYDNGSDSLLQEQRFPPARLPNKITTDHPADYISSQNAQRGYNDYDRYDSDTSSPSTYSRSQNSLAQPSAYQGYRDINGSNSNMGYQHNNNGDWRNRY